MTDNADEIFKQVTATVMSTSSVSLILMVYNVATCKHMSLGWLAVSLIGMSCQLVALVFITIAGGFVNHEAHDAKKYVYEIEMGSNTVENQQLLAWMSRLEGSSIGISVMDMFVLDKPAILTVFGALVSYFTLLLTFSSGDSHVESPITSSQTLTNLTTTANSTLSTLAAQSGR